MFLGTVSGSQSEAPGLYCVPVGQTSIRCGGGQRHAQCGLFCLAGYRLACRGLDRGQDEMEPQPVCHFQDSCPGCRVCRGNVRNQRLAAVGAGNQGNGPGQLPADPSHSGRFPARLLNARQVCARLQDRRPGAGDSQDRQENGEVLWPGGGQGLGKL